MKRKLLHVDDQYDNLVVFRAAFRREFDVLEASSAADALDLFAAHEIPVMVADQRMPDMTGVELCEVVSRQYPHTIRMILTGYIDADDMMEAINTGHVYNFITKPWERQTLLPILLRGFETYDLAISNNALLERLDHAGRCATLGWFAAGIAHEMRNQLFVLPLVELLEEKCQDDEELMQLAHIARQTHDRLSDLIGQVMDFVRMDGETCKRNPVNLAEVAREAVSLAGMDKEIPKQALKLEVLAEPVVRCHKAKIQQVLFNLLKNAADATRRLENRQIRITVERHGEEATLSVQDNGPGIDEECLPRVWEPFFSTKGADGNGLGLDICRRIVEAHNGTISCESTPGRGATFLIRLPTSGNPEDKQVTLRYIGDG